MPELPKRARFLRWEALKTIEGKMRCAVVKLQEPPGARELWTETLWIEPESGLVLQTARVEKKVDEFAFVEEHTRIRGYLYRHVGLPPPASLFTFQPPQGAKQVEVFARPRPH